MIILKNIKKSYGPITNRINIFDSINFEIFEAESVVITGESGSGKSTLLHIVSLLDSPDSGEIILNGVNVFKKKLNEDNYNFDGFFSSKENRKNDTNNFSFLRGISNFFYKKNKWNKTKLENNFKNLSKIDSLRGKNIGYVFQSYSLIDELTAIENVIIPQLIMKTASSYSEAESKAELILKRIGLEERLNHRPSLLSGGEKQRVAIARAMINRPQIIIADEPTGNLDEKNAINVIELFEEMGREFNLAILIATHSSKIAKRFDKMFTIQNQKILQIK